MRDGTGNVSDVKQKIVIQEIGTPLDQGGIGPLGHFVRLGHALQRLTVPSEVSEHVRPIQEHAGQFGPFSSAAQPFDRARVTRDRRFQLPFVSIDLALRTQESIREVRRDIGAARRDRQQLPGNRVATGSNEVFDATDARCKRTGNVLYGRPSIFRVRERSSCVARPIGCVQALCPQMRRECDGFAIACRRR